MKKLFLHLVCIVMIFVMTFALVGCGNSCDHDYSAWTTHHATGTTEQYKTRTCKNCNKVEYHYEHDSTGHHDNSAHH